MSLKTLGVVGSGLMGTGIAQVAATCGFEVLLLDVDAGRLQKGLQTISDSLDRLIKKEKISQNQKKEALARIKTTTDVHSFSQVEFVIEAATESPQVKLELFRQLDRVCKPGVILVSNTSSIPITKIAAVTSRPDKVAGMHFMNPVPLMELVEGVRGFETSETTFKTVRSVAEKMGKTFIESKDSPAFVVNRILVPMLNEAVFALQEGLATKEDIDTAMKLGCRFPMGPFELLDYVGLDTALSILEILYQETGDSKYRPCGLLRKYVEAGRYGRKNGKGFYDYTA